jgi:hypothetical protein
LQRLLTDAEIETLTEDPKRLPHNWRTRLRPRPKQRYQYDERDLAVQGESGNKFRVIARRNRQNLLDFSVILIFEDSDGTEYRLIRYNGVHPSRHTNKWEKEKGLPNSSFGPAFHIHRATERYQLAGYAIDGYAEPTDAFTDFDSALDAFLDGCGFQRPP